MSGFSAPSEEELGNQTDFPVLADDEYILKITAWEWKRNMANKFAKEGEPATHDMLKFDMVALSFANGDDLLDQNDETPDQEVRANVLLDPKKVGMIPQPSKTRKFFAAVLGQPVGERIEIDDYNDLVGKQLIASVRPNNGYNNPYDFRAIRRSRSRGTTNKGPVDGDQLVKRAKEIFDEDAPSNTSPNPQATGDDLDF